jgi:CBS domain containing-hemolysin-like protein
MSTAALLIGMVILLLLQGFFSGAEIAIINCDRSRLRYRAKQGDEGAKLALRLLEQPEVILSTTLVGTNISLVLLTSLATATVIALIGQEGDLLAALLLIPVTLILGEVVPKSIFQQRADDLTPRIIYPLYACYIVLFPAIFFFSRMARLVAQLVGSNSRTDLFVVREQLRAILDTAEGGATIDVFDAARIRNVVRFGEFVAGDVMIPAGDMTAVDVNTGVDEVAHLLRDAGHEHIPVYEGERNNVIGMACFTIWDVTQPDFKDKDIRSITSPAFFVPSQHPLVELLPIIRTRADQSAVVVDEYGSTVGMVTVDTILSTVVGQVNVGSAFDNQASVSQPQWESIGEDVYIMDARLTIADVNDLLGVKIGSTEARSIGGLVIARLRHVPVPGEFIIEEGFRFTVEQASERTVSKLRVEPVSED